MSIIVAVEKDGEIAIAADSLICGADGAISRGAAQKIHQVGQTYIGHAGMFVMQNIIEDYSIKNQERLTSFTACSENEVYRFFLEFRKALLDNYGVVNENPTQNQTPFFDYQQEFIVIGKGGIFLIENNFDVEHVPGYAAGGSGGKYALGLLTGVVDEDCGLNAKELAEMACFTAIENNCYCGGEIVSYVLPKKPA